MKFKSSCLLGVGLLLAALPAGAKPKTNTSQKVPVKLLNKAPFRHNGVVLTQNARGSGFCAWNKQVYFSAAHVVFGETDWVAPPVWGLGVHRQNIRRKDVVRTRGYFHWNQYADLATSLDSRKPSAFSKDVIIGYSFRDLAKGKPAVLNLNGVADLKRGTKSMITGYPAVNAYEEIEISGFFMHRTRPQSIRFNNYSGDALEATLITTGPGNSGGPIWTRNSRGRWEAAGILVGGLPSETVVYGFSPKLNKLLGAAGNLVEKTDPGSLYASGVGASSLFFTKRVNKDIPDGLHKWQRFTTSVKAFDVTATATKVSISLDIRTKHRGDLQVALQAPDGQGVILHNEGGAGRKNLVIRDADVSEFFDGSPANGPWSVLVQDRLKGDIATFRQYRLELSTAGSGGGGGDGGVDPAP